MGGVQVQQFLQNLQDKHPEQHQCVQTIRAMLHTLDADISEEVKYGGLLFGTQQHFCGLFAYTNHVTVEFSEGASLADLYGVLEGNGKYRRHIKIESADDIEHKHLEAYLSQACEHSQPS